MDVIARIRLMEYIATECDPETAWQLIAEMLTETHLSFAFDLSHIGTP